MNPYFPLVTILGPTAVGKTAFGAMLALELNAEIISADSRQVFKGMDIGTGKDMEDYCIGNQVVASHLIDIAEPGTEYNVFQFRRDFQAAYNSIVSAGKVPMLCGGTGMYLESVLVGYDLLEVPKNEVLRNELAKISDDELILRLSFFRPLHNTTDSSDRNRLIRSIEIEEFKSLTKSQLAESVFRNSPVIGIRFERETICKRITSRLRQRLDEGMIEEIRNLLSSGLTKEQLIFYGLEYKYVALFLAGDLDYDRMFVLLNTAIHQFSKRQMTWFRRMEKKGIKIFWLDGEDGLNLNLCKALLYLKMY